MCKRLFILLCLLTGTPLLSLPVGNPSEAKLLWDGFIYMGFWGDVDTDKVCWYDLFSFRAGFYGDYVYNRHLVFEQTIETPDVEKSRFYTNAALLTVNFWDRFDLFTTLGSTDIFLEGNASSFGNPFSGARIAVELGPHFSWSCGIRCSIWEWGFTNLGVQGRYFQTTPEVSRLLFAERESIYPSDIHSKYSEWQLAIGISHRISFLTPYVALKWSRAKFKFFDAIFTLPDSLSRVELFKMENRKNIGCAFGVSLISDERLELTCEARFGDEEALHVNGQIRF